MRLEPLPYHVAVAEDLERAEPELWAWFRSDAFSKSYKAATDKDLLRTAIRLDRPAGNFRQRERIGRHLAWVRLRVEVRSAVLAA